MCSSTPRLVTPVKRDSSAARRSSSGRTRRHSAHHDTSSRRASPAMVACSRRSCPIAHVTARGDLGAWCDQRRDLLDERPSRASRLRAPPGALPPHQPDPDLAMRHVVQDPPPAAAARRHDPAVRAALQLPRRRDRHRHRRLGPLDRLDMDRRQAEQHVTARTRVSSGGRVGAPRSVGQRRGPQGRSVVGASDHRGPRPLHPARHAARATPYRIDEEPLYLRLRRAEA